MLLVKCVACKEKNRLGVEEHNLACATTGERAYSAFVPTYRGEYTFAMAISRAKGPFDGFARSFTEPRRLTSRRPLYSGLYG